MSGPFTTITVNQYHRMQDTIHAADELAKVAADVAMHKDCVVDMTQACELCKALVKYQGTR